MTCKQIAKLLSEGREHELPLAQRLMIRIHLWLCIFCRRLARQLAFIHRFSQAAGDAAEGSLISDGDVFDVTLPGEARSRMKKILAYKNL